jgi:hypothetical protein
MICFAETWSHDEQWHLAVSMWDWFRVVAP